MTPLQARPRIAIPVPTTGDLAYNQRSWHSYADAVARSGGEPVRVELGLEISQLRGLAATCAGVCLPGSPADVDPALYGEEVNPATAPADRSREACDYFFLEDADRHRKPVLAICFGVQSLNTWRGGSLVQDIAPLPVNHAAGSAVAIAHAVLVPEHSLLGELLKESSEAQAEASVEDGFLRLPVNTSHHQAVASPGEGLRIVARCPDDGVIEAVEGDPDWVSTETQSSERRPQFLLGVQWHPERSYDISAASRALFDRLIAEARVPAAGSA